MEAKTLGLTLNSNKSGILPVDVIVRNIILYSIPGVQIVSSEITSFQGSALDNVTSIDDALLGKSTTLQQMGAHFKYLTAHTPLFCCITPLPNQDYNACFALLPASFPMS